MNEEEELIEATRELGETQEVLIAVAKRLFPDFNSFEYDMICRYETMGDTLSARQARSLRIAWELG